MQDQLVANIKAELASLANQETDAYSVKFFKTAPGQYGEGNQFIGIRVAVAVYSMLCVNILCLIMLIMFAVKLTTLTVSNKQAVKKKKLNKL
jgi:hypothetical protein